jgi:hypothetical protein
MAEGDQLKLTAKPRLFLLGALAAPLLPCAIAQTQPYAVITASKIVDAQGTLLPSGQFCAQPVNNNTQPIPFLVSGGGNAGTKTKCANVVSGAITSPVDGAATYQLANSQVTTPANVCYNIKVTDNSDGSTVLGGGTEGFQSGYNCVQMNSNWCSVVSSVYTCNFDNYQPNETALATTQYGPQGPQGPSGTMSVGTVTQGPTGSTATVTNSGTSTNAVWNFGIPTAPAGTDSNAVHTNTTAAQAIEGPITAPEVNGEWVAPASSDPATTIASACASSSRSVYLPAGVYPTAGNIGLCSGLQIRCAASDVVGASTGSVIQLKSTAAAVWLLQNANAGATTGNTSVRNVTVLGCTFDISQDSSALGALNLKGILWSRFDGTNWHSNGNAHPVITQDGANYAVNGGDYNNDFIANTMYDDSTTANDVAVYATDSSSTGSCSNDNHWLGGSIQNYGTNFLLDCANNNTIFSVDGENWRYYSVHLSYQSTGGGVASGNQINSLRNESGTTTAVAAVQIDNNNGIKGNLIVHPYMSGSNSAAIAVNDPTSQNKCLDCVGYINSTTTIYGDEFNGPIVGNGPEFFGINEGWLAQYTALQPYGGLAVGGNLNVAANSDGGGNASVAGTLGVGGAVTVGGALSVTGTTSVSGLDVSGVETFTGTNGANVPNRQGNLWANGNIGTTWLSGGHLYAYSNATDYNSISISAQSGNATGGASGGLINCAYSSGGSADCTIANAGTVALWTHGGNAYVGGGTNVIYRCPNSPYQVYWGTTAPSGCGTPVDTGLRTK